MSETALVDAPLKWRFLRKVTRLWSYERDPKGGSFERFFHYALKTLCLPSIIIIWNL